ncbi:hypothetical protein [Novosphingobium sp.]|uniref:hypothetical protein n=1 Tax=Novosphingobium sp. TaxID=1874826 RepID=UPI003B529BD4
MNLDKLTVGAVKAVLLFSVLLIAGCGSTTYPPYRYKETVIVQTPQGIRSGYTVIEVRMYKEGQSNPFDGGAIHGKVKGEAAAIELPDGRTLFALLTSPANHGWAQGAYQMLAQLTPDEMAKPYNPNNTAFDIQYRRAMAMKGPQVLPRAMPSGAAEPGRFVSGYPWFVTFVNINDPNSVQVVDPDNLAATFGEGYKLKSIILEKTSDPLGHSIRKILPWISHKEDYRYDKSNPFTSKIPAILDGIEF